MPPISYRPFKEADFEPIAHILLKAWHENSGTEGYRALAAQDDLAYSLASATFSQVVVVDEKPGGIVLARLANPVREQKGIAAANPSEENARPGNPAADRSEAPPDANAGELDADRWMALDNDLMARMRAADPVAAAAHLAFIDAETRVNDGLLRRADVDGHAEIVLLAVDERLRGIGVGGALLDAALSYCARAGAHGAYLFTDTSCTWTFYEHRGLTRLAEHRSTAEERRLLPRELYLYGTPLSS